MLSREDIQVILSSSEEDVVKPAPPEEPKPNPNGPKHFLGED